MAEAKVRLSQLINGALSFCQNSSRMKATRFAFSGQRQAEPRQARARLRQMRRKAFMLQKKFSTRCRHLYFSRSCSAYPLVPGRARWRNDHDTFLQLCPEEQRRAIAGVVDIPQHETKIAGLVDGGRRQRVCFEQREAGRKFSGAEAGLVEGLSFSRTAVEDIKVLARVVVRTCIFSSKRAPIT